MVLALRPGVRYSNHVSESGLNLVRKEFTSSYTARNFPSCAYMFLSKEKCNIRPVIFRTVPSCTRLAKHLL
jgi:hypothetical protein